MGGVEGPGIGTGVAILGGQAKGLFEVGERGPDVSKGDRRLRRGLTQRVHYSARTHLRAPPGWIRAASLPA